MKLEQLIKKDLRTYRPIPFWSWNDKLEDGELKRQIKEMKDAGMGGFFMHARGGLITEYLSKEWFHMVQVCIEEAERLDMDAWCYDENGWPSGFAGMKLLEDSANWAHFITCETKSEYDQSALAVYILENSHIIRVTEERPGTTEYLCVYDNTNSSVVDVLNERVVADFINETHEKYYAEFSEHFGQRLVGFFTDEPQYFRWDTAYSPVILEEYQKEYNETLLDTLGALFVYCEEAYETRFKYWRLMNKQFTKSFGKQIYDWCEAHNCKLTGHVVEESKLFAQMWCCAGVMPFYEYEHVPGCDWLGRDISTEIMPRQLSSVAMQLGKKQVLTESFACTGWDVTPRELKRILEWQYVHGVNLFCPHLTPYSLRGSRKLDHPAFFSDCNPWFKHFDLFSDYFAKLGILLSESSELADVVVIHPMHSAYLTYNRKDDYESIKELEDGFAAFVEKLGANQIGHHYADELLLEKYGRVEENRLIIGNCSYTKVVLPIMQGLDSSTVKLLRQFVNGGGKLYLEGTVPEYVNGRKTALDFLNSNCTFEELQSDSISVNLTDTEIRSTYRKSSTVDFLYAVNLSDSKEYTAEYRIKAKGAALFDLKTGKTTPLFYQREEDYITLPLTFEAGQSFFVVLDDTAIPAEKNEETKSKISLPTAGKVITATENTLVLDKAELSYDNVEYSSKMPLPGISELLLKARKNCTVFLKYSFFVKESPNSLFLEAEDMNIKNIWINDRAVTLSGKGSIDRGFLRGEIAEYIKSGENKVVIELSYFQSEDVYRILFDTPDATESIINCLTYDTEIDSIYLRGDFAVSAEAGYVTDKQNCSITEDKFYITTAPEQIDFTRINEQGYPFFAGHITLEVPMPELARTDYRLKLSGRFAAAEIEVNGKPAGTLLLEDECDLGKYLQTGKNTMRITLSNGGRNLFGPFHLKNDTEPLIVFPSLLNMKDSWVDGKSDLYTDSYAFIQFGLEQIILM